MQKYLTRKNLGWLLTAILTFMLTSSIYGKLTGHVEAVTNLSSHNLKDWVTIIGLGELGSLLLFIIPATHRLGAMLLAAYFGGAIMFHMSHPDPTNQSFVGASVFLTAVMIITWVRGNELIKL